MIKPEPSDPGSRDQIRSRRVTP